MSAPLPGLIPPGPPQLTGLPRWRNRVAPHVAPRSELFLRAEAKSAPPLGGHVRSVASDVVVLLPALNEEEGVGAVIDEIPREGLRRLGHEVRVWVVDGKSTDGTLEVARERGAGVFVQRGEGKGNGVRQAMNHLMRHGYDPAAPPRAFVMLDADGSYPPEALTRFVEALDAGYDVVVGSRFRGHVEDGAISSLNRIGDWALSRLAGLLFGVPVSDVCTGMWAFREDALRRFGLAASGFDLEADLFASVCEAGARLKELPIDYRRRIGQPKLVPLRTGFLIAWRLLLRRLNRPPGAHAPRRRRERSVAEGTA